jgi:hypothetical protein
MAAGIRTHAADLRGQLRRMSNGERAILGGSLVALIATLFLPWMTGSCAGSCGGISFGASLDGLHGWGLLALVALLAVACLRLVRTFPHIVRMPALPLTDSEIYMVAGAVEVLAVVLFWVEYHDTFGDYLTLSVSPGVGWFLALVGGVATTAGGWLLRKQGSTGTPTA